MKMLQMQQIKLQNKEQAFLPWTLFSDLYILHYWINFSKQQYKRVIQTIYLEFDCIYPERKVFLYLSSKIEFLTE